MRTSPDRIKARRAVLALAELARDTVQPPTQARLEEQLQVLSARVGPPRARARVRWTLVGAAAIAATAVIAVRAGWLSRAPWLGREVPALAYRIEGGTVMDGGYLRDVSGAGMKLAFSGGTQVALAAGTRGYLRSVDGTGARIAIEHGTASFEVAPQPGRKWLVDVGPFLVMVKGTAFTVSWDVATERFELRLRRGRVTVSGPLSGGDVALVAGHRLLVDLRRAETLISELKAEPPAEPARDVSPAVAPERPAQPPAPSMPRTARASTAARSPVAHGWSRALAAGRFDEILAEADRAGARSVLDGASSDDLLALADAARYRRRLGLARDALLAARRRFSETPRASDTAYLLGRVEEAGHGPSEALRWYDDYLSHEPRGTYAAEALGRKMILTDDLRGATRAKPIADEYLRRFPNGTYAGAARALGRAP